jgi:hypothetical protein
MISGNSATSGGGVYVGNDFIRSSVCHLSGGVISNNRATGNGGGVWVTDDSSYLERLFVSDGVVFSNNHASAAYSRAAAFNDVYNSHIGSRVTWTTPFTQGYNNYDISYVYGTSLTQYTVIVRDSYASITGAGNYSAGISVTINSGTRDNYAFSGWSINEGSVTLSNSTTATFTMPANNVDITVNWRPTSSNESVPEEPITNTPTPNTPITSNPAPNNPTHNGGGGGSVIIFPTTSDKGNLLTGSIGYIIVVGCIVLIAVGIAVVLLHKKQKNSAQL